MTSTTSEPKLSSGLKVQMAAGVIAFASGSIGLGSKSFWDDEAFSAAAAQLPTDDLVDLSLERDPHTALWHLVLRGWIAIGGDSEFWIRSLSLILGAVAAVLLWRLAAKLFDSTVASVATVFFVFSETFLRFAQDARPGMLTMLLCILAVTFAVRLVQDPRLVNAVGWGALSALAIYGHPFAAAVPAATVVALAALPGNRQRIRLFATAATSFVLVAAPIALLLALRSGNDNLDWVTELGLRPVLTGVFLLSGGGYIATGIVVALVLGLFLVIALRTLIVHHQSFASWRLVLVGLWLTALPIGLIVLSLISPSFVARYLAPAFPAVAIAIGYIVVAAAKRYGRLIPAIVLSVICASSVFHWHNVEEKDDWRNLAATLDTQADPGDVVIAMGHRAALDYYYVAGSNPSTRPEFPERPWGSQLPTREVRPAILDDEAFDSLVGDANAVWVTALEYDEIPDELGQRLLLEFGAPHTQNLGGDLQLHRYGKSP
jgi:mannosyltransferase